MKRLIIQTDATAQQLVDYLNAVNTVTHCAMQVGNTTLPTLVTPPDNYGNYANVLASGKVNTLAWENEILTSFNTLPNAYISFNNQIQLQLQLVQTNLQVLKNEPGNTAAISAIKSAITSLVKETNPGVTYFSNLGKWITTYAGGLKPFADNLATLCTQIIQAEKVDESAIAKLNDANNVLQNLVDGENELITLATVGNVIFNIFIAVVGVAIGIPFTGPVAPIIVGALFGISSAVYTTLDPLMSPPPFAQDQKQLQDEMNQVNTEIGAMNTIVGQLKITANQFQNLIDESEQAGQYIQLILNFWLQLENDLGNLVSDLDDILSKLTDESSINEALQDIANAQQSWNDLQKYMNNIKGIQYVLPSGVIMPENSSI